MSNVYYDPEDFGLTTVGEVNFVDGWEFDITAVWRDKDGELYYADDSGCSCPAPFEDHTLSTLVNCTKAQLRAHLLKRNQYGYNDGDKTTAIHNLLDRV